jgi:hypothetical protein
MLPNMNRSSVGASDLIEENEIRVEIGGDRCERKDETPSKRKSRERRP